MMEISLEFNDDKLFKRDTGKNIRTYHTDSYRSSMDAGMDRDMRL